LYAPERHLPTSGQHGPAPSGTPPPAQPPPPPHRRHGEHSLTARQPHSNGLFDLFTTQLAKSAIYALQRGEADKAEKLLAACAQSLNLIRDEAVEHAPSLRASGSFSGEPIYRYMSIYLSIYIDISLY